MPRVLDINIYSFPTLQHEFRIFSLHLGDRKEEKPYCILPMKPEIFIEAKNELKYCKAKTQILV